MREHGGPHSRRGDELLFEPEFLCGKRVAKDGTTEYRVQWVGNYAKKDKRSWEPEYKIHHEWIDAYEATLKGRSRKRTKKTKKRTPFTVLVAGNATAPSASTTWTGSRYAQVTDLLMRHFGSPRAHACSVRRSRSTARPGHAWARFIQLREKLIL